MRASRHLVRHSRGRDPGDDRRRWERPDRACGYARRVATRGRRNGASRRRRHDGCAGGEAHRGGPLLHPRRPGEHQPGAGDDHRRKSIAARHKRHRRFRDMAFCRSARSPAARANWSTCSAYGRPGSARAPTNFPAAISRRSSSPGSLHGSRKCCSPARPPGVSTPAPPGSCRSRSSLCGMRARRCSTSRRSLKRC